MEYEIIPEQEEISSGQTRADTDHLLETDLLSPGLALLSLTARPDNK